MGNTQNIRKLKFIISLIEFAKHSLTREWESLGRAYHLVSTLLQVSLSGEDKILDRNEDIFLVMVNIPSVTHYP